MTAAYNTGAIAAAGSANVGGIAGTNSGTLDQVFSHIMTADKTKEAVQGQSNVGGLVGTNTGIVSNAYSTGGVTGSESSVGTLAGANTGTLENVYGKGTLVGTGNAAKNGYDLSDSSFQQTKKTSYGGYDFAKTWRIYDGSSTPLLKVFLTNLTLQDTAVVDGKELSLQDYLGLTYTGREQDLDIHDLIAKGFLTGPDGMDSPFAAYDSTTLQTPPWGTAASCTIQPARLTPKTTRNGWLRLRSDAVSEIPLIPTTWATMLPGRQMPARLRWTRRRWTCPSTIFTAYTETARCTAAETAAASCRITRLTSILRRRMAKGEL